MEEKECEGALYFSTVEETARYAALAAVSDRYKTNISSLIL